MPGITKAIKKVLPGFLRGSAESLYDYIRYLVHVGKQLGRKKYFIVGGKSYPYFLHPYNSTWNDERAVEISYMCELVRRATSEGKRILEIGNVLSNYFAIAHEVVDKYEKSRYPRLLNVDFNDFNPPEKYDVIISISTFEHIGKIDAPEFRGRVIDAIEHAKRLLKPKGIAVITVPAGYNDYLDHAITDGRITFDAAVCLRRKPNRNEWEETDLATALQCPYVRPYPGATGLIIGTLTSHDGK
jgi:SAM-dependent methyltransferase